MRCGGGLVALGSLASILTALATIAKAIVSVLPSGKPKFKGLKKTPQDPHERKAGR